MSRPPVHALCDEIEQLHHADGADDHDQRKQVRRIPVRQRVGLLVEQRRQHQVLAAAEQGGRRVGADRAGEHHDRGHQRAAEAHGDDDLEERDHRGRSQRLRRFDRLLADALHDRHERADHDRQKEVDGTDDDGSLGVQHLHRLLDEVETDKPLVQKPVLAENGDPGEAADDRIGQQGEKDDGMEDLPLALALHGQVVGGGDAEHRAAGGRDQGKAQRAVENPPVELIAEEPDVVPQSERGSGECRQDGQAQGNHEEQDDGEYR